jgi:hypothetical protein
MVDRALGRLPGLDLCRTGETAREREGGGLRDDHDTLANLATEEVGGGRLPATGTTGKDDATSSVGSAVRIGNPVRSKQIRGCGSPEKRLSSRCAQRRVLIVNSPFGLSPTHSIRP